MKPHAFDTRRTLPITLQAAWSFFSDPRDLAPITDRRCAWRARARRPAGRTRLRESFPYRREVLERACGRMG